MKYFWLYFLVVILQLTSFAKAEVYKWTDDKGVVHYGDQPHDRKATLFVPHQSNNIFTPKKVEELAENKNNSLSSTQSNPEKLMRTTADTKRCEYLRSRLQIFNQVGRLAIMSPEGKRNYLSDQQRGDQLAQLKKEVEMLCQ